MPTPTKRANAPSLVLCSPGLCRGTWAVFVVWLRVNGQDGRLSGICYRLQRRRSELCGGVVELIYHPARVCEENRTNPLCWTYRHGGHTSCPELGTTCPSVCEGIGASTPEDLDPSQTSHQVMHHGAIAWLIFSDKHVAHDISFQTTTGSAQSRLCSIA